ncbi:hypothetical protein Hanom_Chr03g00233961 [Helianthus anomalus]
MEGTHKYITGKPNIKMNPLFHWYSACFRSFRSPVRFHLYSFFPFLAFTFSFSNVKLCLFRMGIWCF